jgi:putative PEP-CTERM system histidine kinase
VFLVGSILVLAILLFSGQIRAKARVFVSKHFYNYRYDYREEWLRFSRTMTGEGDQPPLRERVIQGIAQVVESSGGALWQVRDGELVPVASFNVSLADEVGEPLDGELARFIAETEWVLTIDEWQRNPDRYRSIALPDWLQSMPRAWLLVPLLHHDRLQGFVVLTRSIAGRSDLNWEDFDLLKIIGRQAASYLAQEEAAQALSRAQQFETFSRLSAFVLHDLKNIIGQLSMLARNARRHRDSPAFMADAVDTLEHSVERMNQLMNQLRGGVQAGTIKVFDLGEAVREAVSLHTNDDPVPRAELHAEGVRARADRGRLVAVLGNLIQNACEATASDGSVRVILRRSEDSATVDVVDTGTGMDQDFIRNRLFRPFDTSKGTTGMGIGAFEAREFARGLGGDLEVSSVPGEGTRFSLYIPREVLVESGPESAIEATR